MSAKIEKYVQNILQAFSWLAGFHKLQGSKNVLGQLLQNKGNSFSLNGMRYDGVSWASKKDAMDNKRKEKNQNPLDWPDTVTALSSADTQLGHLFLAYVASMFFSKLSWRDIYTSMLLTKAFPDKESWDKWIEEKKYAVLFDEDKEHTAAWTPTWEMLQEISQVCTKLAEIRGYSSLDNVSAREAVDIDGLFNV